MSKPVRKSLLEILKRAKKQRDYLIAEIIDQRRVMLKQQAFIREQDAAYRKLFDEIKEPRDGMPSLKALAVRYIAK